jgi:hypothetical protein
MIDKDYISFIDIKEKMKELGFYPWDSVYYQKKGSNGNFMVELTNDACVMKMLEEFEPYKEIHLHFFKTAAPDTLPFSKNGEDSYNPVPVVAVEENYAHEDEWVKTSSPDIDPPAYTIPAGRPKKNRRKGLEEDGPSCSRARKTTVQCGNCRESGHNMKGCSKPLKPYLALRVRKHVVSCQFTLLILISLL